MLGKNKTKIAYWKFWCIQTVMKIQLLKKKVYAIQYFWTLPQQQIDESDRSFRKNIFILTLNIYYFYLFATITQFIPFDSILFNVTCLCIYSYFIYYILTYFYFFFIRIFSLVFFFHEVLFRKLLRRLRK